MIRVNLLGDQTAVINPTFAALTISRHGVILALILLSAAGAMAVWSRSIHRQITAATEKRATLRAKEAHLHEVEKEIEDYQRTRQRLQTRIDAIEQLRESQTGPVLLLNTILESIPQTGNLWLISLTQESGDTKIVGFAQHAGAIPDLMSNLIASGIFDTVDLEEIENRKEVSKFSLLCRNIRNTLERIR